MVEPVKELSLMSMLNFTPESRASSVGADASVQAGALIFSWPSVVIR